jgi:uncharacterized protein YlxW (UPF0749 family)
MTDQHPPPPEAPDPPETGPPVDRDEPATETAAEPAAETAAEPAADPSAEPEAETSADTSADTSAEPEADTGEPERPGPAGRSRFAGTRLLVALLLGLLGFTFAIQVRSVAEDPTVAALGEEDLVRILANLDALEERLRADIDELQDTRRRLTTAGQSQQEALAEAERRADELGILAGTLPAEGPGIRVVLHGGSEAVDAATLLDTVQELRGAGAEAIQVEGAQGAAIRVVAASYFLDGQTGIVVDGELLRGPYTLVAIGEPQTLTPALHIPGGVVESVQQDGGTVTVHEEPGGVQVSAVRQPATLQHARPDS